MLYFHTLTYIQLDGLNRPLRIERIDGLLYIIHKEILILMYLFLYTKKFWYVLFSIKIVSALQLLFSVTPFHLFGRVFDALQQCFSCCLFIYSNGVGSQVLTTLVTALPLVTALSLLYNSLLFFFHEWKIQSPLLIQVSKSVIIKANSFILKFHRRTWVITERGNKVIPKSMWRLDFESNVTQHCFHAVCLKGWGAF